MKLIRQYTDISPIDRGAVVVLGNFDGVHLGHQAVIRKARALADEMGVPLGVVVFEPHPREFFRRNDRPFRLTPLSVKSRLLDEAGVDLLYAISFDQVLAAKMPADFIMDVLVEGIGAIHVVVGYDFQFGAGRTGDTAVLAYMGEAEGYGVTVIEPVTYETPRRPDNDDEIYSSTRIRTHLREGRPADAARLLGHFWTVEGEVLLGDQRGRTIGFPTANLSMENTLKPRLGVYAVRIEILEGDDQGTYEGVANVGNRPTFDKEEINLEVHLFRYGADLYGRRISVSFIEFIRPEQKFDGLDALKSQIRKDCKTAEDILIESRKSA